MDDERFQVLHTVDDKFLDALLDVWDAATEESVTNRSDSDLLRILAAAVLVEQLCKRARTLASTAVAELHPRKGWALQEPGLGKVSTTPRFQERHDIGQAFLLIACQVYGETGEHVDPIELPTQIKALVTRCAALFTPSTTLSLPAMRAQGLSDDDVVVKTPIDPKVTFTPAKEL